MKTLYRVGAEGFTLSRTHETIEEAAQALASWVATCATNGIFPKVWLEEVKKRERRTKGDQL